MNDRLIINGGKRLSGNFDVQGSKNESFQVMCACLLTKEKVIIKNLPDITDVASLIDIFKLLNVKVEKLNEHDYSFCAKDLLNFDQIDLEILRKHIKSKGFLKPN